MRCPEEHTPLGTCCWPGSQLRSAHSPSPAGRSTAPRGRQRGTATALQCLRGWEGAQKPNFPIIRPKVSNSGPSFGYQHPCSLHRRQSPGMSMGCGWAQAAASVSRHGTGCGEQVFWGTFGALWVEIRAVPAEPQLHGPSPALQDRVRDALLPQLGIGCCRTSR